MLPSRCIFLLSYIVLLAFLAFSPATAQAQNCPRHKTLMILDPVITKVKIFRSSSHNMTQWATGHTQTVGAILGLGGGEIGTKFQAAFKYSTTPDGRVCVQLDKVKAIFYAYPRMYIASDYKKGTCEYNEIIQHEKRHIKALIEAHEENTDKLQTHLGRIAKRIPMFGPVSGEEVPYVKQRMMDYVMGEYLDYQNHQLMALQREQQKIDSPNEYRGVAARCDNW